MDIEIYDENIGRLERWHRKELTSDQHEIFYKMLEPIKNIAFSEVVESWIKFSKPMPAHFPTIKDLNELWRKWQTEHPELFQKKERPQCDECHSRGWLWFRVQTDNRMQEYIVGCASCFGFKLDIGSRYIHARTRQELENKGLEVWPYLYRSNIKFKSVQEMIEAIGNSEDDIPF
jgi:hypothetical protein